MMHQQSAIVHFTVLPDRLWLPRSPLSAVPNDNTSPSALDKHTLVFSVFFLCRTLSEGKDVPFRDR